MPAYQFIIELYLRNYTFTEIERKTNHSETSVKRYLADFVQVITLINQNFSANQIRLIAQKSERLIKEYQQIFRDYQKQNNQRLAELLNPNKKKRSDAMTKSLTKEQAHLKRFRRLKSKNLQQVLTYQFLNHYGYDKGEITVKAIVNDLLNLLENYFLLSPKPDDLQFLNYGYLT
jgi:hypothetical protein